MRSAAANSLLRLGADAVGYTLFVGSPNQDVDIAQCNEVRRECERYGMPLIIWAYPRGSAMKSKGGIDTFLRATPDRKLSPEIQRLKRRVARAAARNGSGPQLPGNHSPLFAPVPKPTIETGVTAMTLAVLSAFDERAKGN